MHFFWLEICKDKTRRWDDMMLVYDRNPSIFLLDKIKDKKEASIFLLEYGVLGQEEFMNELHGVIENFMAAPHEEARHDSIDGQADKEDIGEENSQSSVPSSHEDKGW